MEKIGLCVCYDTKNFGSQLQVLATNYQISKLGYDSEIIVYQKKISLVMIFQSVPRFFNPYFLKSKCKKIEKKIRQDREITQKLKIRNKRFEQFVNTHYHNLSKPFVGWTTLKREAPKKYNAFLCGSDQLWLPGNLGSHFYTLEFVPDNIKKISYATSFGVSHIPWFQRRQTRKFLSRFQYLSVREESGVRIIKDLINKDAKRVCDPTLLLTKRDWDTIIPSKKILNEKYIFAFLLGDDVSHRKSIESLQDRTGLKIVTIPFLNNYVKYDKLFGDYRLYDVDAFDFVNLIRYAEYVITDSFHGSVFSIIYHKKFLIFNRFSDRSKDSRNSRIDNLCNSLGLNKRRFHTNLVEEVNRPIDYNKVDLYISKMREESLEYLKKILSN